MKRTTPLFLIDSFVGPDSPVEQIEAWIEQCERMLQRYPGHPQWAMELEDARHLLRRAKRLRQEGVE
jgi:hypothetical protein